MPAVRGHCRLYVVQARAARAAGEVVCTQEGAARAANSLSRALAPAAHGPWNLLLTVAAVVHGHRQKRAGHLPERHAFLQVCTARAALLREHFNLFRGQNPNCSQPAPSDFVCACNGFYQMKRSLGHDRQRQIHFDLCKARDAVPRALCTSDFVLACNSLYLLHMDFVRAAVPRDLFTFVFIRAAVPRDRCTS